MTDIPQTSPFHRGEQAIQDRVGVRERAEALGRRVIRDHLTEQHQTFFAGLPYLFLGSVDDAARPSASMLVGVPGFIATPESRTIRIAATPVNGDPLERNLRVGANIGVLGIDYGTRRRNRIAATVARAGRDGFELSVVQSFGNCPRYIQRRTPEVLAGSRPGAVSVHDTLDDASDALIRGSDNFYIASVYDDGSGGPANGVDVSHRGGLPGFVRIEDERTLIYPEFDGNNHFNTLGNLYVNPRAGLLFVDFASGDALFLTCTAEIVWDDAAASRYPGAVRFVRFRIEAGFRVEHAFPVRWTFGDYSRFLRDTGTWTRA